MNENSLKVTAIIPALNEEKNIEEALLRTLAGFNRYNLNGTIVVVNDGSTDHTPAIVKDMAKAEPRIKLISHDRPRGIGAGFWTGVDNAEGDFVVMIPGDNESDPWEIFRYAPLLRSVDIINPFVFNKGVRSAFRTLVSKLYTFIITCTFGVDLRYTNGTVLYRKSVLQTLPSRDESFFYQTDILIRLVRQGYLFAEVPCKLFRRKDGKTKAISLKSLRCVMKGYLRLLGGIYFKSNETDIPENSQTYARRSI